MDCADQSFNISFDTDISIDPDRTSDGIVTDDQTLYLDRSCTSAHVILEQLKNDGIKEWAKQTEDQRDQFLLETMDPIFELAARWSEALISRGPSSSLASLKLKLTTSSSNARGGLRPLRRFCRRALSRSMTMLFLLVSPTCSFISLDKVTMQLTAFIKCSNHFHKSLERVNRDYVK
ncbi:hypothetical protein BJ165DRAFT_1473649 [Panaeolus papilionaceus]|nr:hypothetical protein BJ165DRAFT_1473649 [Panaeolus papilionaceus]